ncbi:MAG: M28 family peptidase [Bacteroidota bacterium]
MDFTKEVCSRWTARLTGSEACRACADYLAETFESFCDRVEVQEFAVRPGAFLGYIRINVGLFFGGFLAIFFQQIEIAVFLSSLALLITVLEFFIYKEFVDFLFPKKFGKNVIGSIEPVEELKQQIIVSAHHDSAHIFNFLANNPKSYPRKIILATVAQLLMFLGAWIIWIFVLNGYQVDVLYWGMAALLTLTVVDVGRMWFFYAAEGTPGAGDNMICTAVALEIGKYLAEQKKQGKGLKHTRIVIASWDAEEAGLRGSRAFVKQNRGDLSQIKTYNYNLECLYDHRAMAFLISDLNSFVPLSKALASDCQDAAKELGYEIPTAPFPFLAGGTDAAELAKAGVEATTLIGMDFNTKGEGIAYHTLRDTIEAVDEVAVERSIAIGLEYIARKDQELQVSSNLD